MEWNFYYFIIITIKTRSDTIRYDIRRDREVPENNIYIYIYCYFKAITLSTITVHRK